MYKFATSILIGLSILPGAALADVGSAIDATSSPSQEARVLLIGQYIQSAGCPAGNSACQALATTIAKEMASSSAVIAAQQNASAIVPRETTGGQTAPVAPRTIAAPIAKPMAAPTYAYNSSVKSVPVPVSMPAHALSYTPAPGIATNPAGNGLLRNLPALFVLNALFQHDPSGIITPGGASLGNVIILYQIFFASKMFAA